MEDEEDKPRKKGRLESSKKALYSRWYKSKSVSGYTPEQLDQILGKHGLEKVKQDLGGDNGSHASTANSAGEKTDEKEKEKEKEKNSGLVSSVATMDMDAYFKAKLQALKGGNTNTVPEQPAVAATLSSATHSSDSDSSEAGESKASETHTHSKREHSQSKEKEKRKSKSKSKSKSRSEK